jgi:hypothetical protein
MRAADDLEPDGKSVRVAVFVMEDFRLADNALSRFESEVETGFLDGARSAEAVLGARILLECDERASPVELFMDVKNKITIYT